MASTLDILPTIAGLAGAKLPQVMLDGVDMKDILINQGKVVARLTLCRQTWCTIILWFSNKTFALVLQSKRETMIFYPTDPSEKYSMFALRLGKYKAHFYTRGSRLHVYRI